MRTYPLSLVMLLAAGPWMHLVAEVEPDREREIEIEIEVPQAPLPAGLRDLVGAGVHHLLEGDRAGFLALFATNPEFAALRETHGEGLGFADEASFDQWRDTLARVQEQAGEFRDEFSGAVMASDTAVGDLVLRSIEGHEESWNGIPSVARLRAAVQLNHELVAVIRFGRAAALAEGWAFIEPPEMVVEVHDPEPHEVEVDYVDLTAMRAAIP